MCSGHYAQIPKKKAPQDMSHHLSEVSKLRVQSAVKAFYKYFQIPGMANLAGGLPNVSLFPFDSLEATTATVDRFPIKSKDSITSGHIAVPKSTATHEIDLESALQYGQANGYPSLLEWVKDFALNYQHGGKIPYAGGADVTMCCGSTDGLAKITETLVNDWVEGRDPISEREHVLVEKFCYMSAVTGMTYHGVAPVPVEIDGEGMLPDGPGGVEDILANWDYSRGKRPRLLYTVSIGQNPTGGVLSIERKRQIYQLAQKYDIIIIEDEPYWFLQFPSTIRKHNDDVSTENAFAHLSLSDNVKKAAINATKQEISHNMTTTVDSPHLGSKKFLESLSQSYLTIDTAGRVLRLDTFSKVVAPGCRLGWITGQPALIERITRLAECSTQQPSGFVQSMIVELIKGKSGWNMDGWIRWLEGLRDQYEQRMLDMSHALMASSYYVAHDSSANDNWEVVTKKKIYSFVWPMGGMFLWMKVHLSDHPLASEFTGEQLMLALWISLTKAPYLVVISPGTMFSPTPEVKEEFGYSYFRLCFGAAPADEITDISKRTGEGIKAFWDVDADTVKDLLGEVPVVNTEKVSDMTCYPHFC